VEFSEPVVFGVPTGVAGVECKTTCQLFETSTELFETSTTLLNFLKLL
jgi:hypothetical protein